MVTIVRTSNPTQMVKFENKQTISENENFQLNKWKGLRTHRGKAFKTIYTRFLLLQQSPVIPSVSLASSSCQQLWPAVYLPVRNVCTLRAVPQRICFFFVSG
jgi:hypothetical protein